MKPLLFCVAAASIFALVPAGAQTGAGTPPLTNSGTPNIPPPSVLKLPGSAQPGTVTTDRRVYRRGQPVRIAFRIRNASNKSLTYNFSSGQKYDVTIQDAGGQEVWDWSQGMRFAQNLTAVTILPGRSISYFVLWNGYGRSGRAATPGRYTVHARLTSRDRPAITGGVVVNTDRDPNNLGFPTQTPAESGAIRQINTAPPVSADAVIVVR